MYIHIMYLHYASRRRLVNRHSVLRTVFKTLKVTIAQSCELIDRSYLTAGNKSTQSVLILFRIFTNGEVDVHMSDFVFENV